MKKLLISALKVVVPLGIGLYLTWYFVSNLTTDELQNLKEAFIIADYRFIFLTIIVALASHMSRAYRWRYLLEPLGYKPKFWKMYHAVMIGYLINLTIPRSGEVARAGYYSRFEKGVTFEKAFGTIIVERVIDMLMLGLATMVTFYLQKDIEAFNNITNRGQGGGSVPMWVYIAAVALFAVGVIVVLKIPALKSKFLGLIKGVFEGVKTILKLKQRTAYIAHTFFIWICYIAMIWVCTYALPETSQLSINAIFAAFFVGGIAIAAAPGGIGFYPFMVSAVLGLYGVENPQSFGMLAWTMLTVFTIVAGLISLVALPFTTKSE